MLSFGFRIFCWCRGFCHRTGSDLLLFLFCDKSKGSIDLNQREKEGDLTQSFDKTPYTNRINRKQKDNTQTPPKTSITQRLRTDLGRSVGVTTVIQLVLLN